MKFITLSVFTLVLALSTNALASPNADFIQKLNSGHQTPFELLKENFDAGTAATFKDIPNLKEITSGNKSQFICTSAAGPETKERNIHASYYATLISGPFYIENGEPATGPLFPGKPAVTVEKHAFFLHESSPLTLTDSKIVDILKELYSSSEYSCVETSDGILVDYLYDADDGTKKRVRYTVRINNGMLFIKHTDKAIYNYCWTI